MKGKDMSRANQEDIHFLLRENKTLRLDVDRLESTLTRLQNVTLIEDRKRLSELETRYIQTESDILQLCQDICQHPHASVCGATSCGERFNFKCNICGHTVWIDATNLTNKQRATVKAQGYKIFGEEKEMKDELETNDPEKD